MRTAVSIRNGSIYISAHDYAAYFGGVTTAIVLIRDQRLQILPVQQVTAGGYLLKIRNAKGDRVLAAPDVFAHQGLSHWHAEGLPARWSHELAALVCEVPGSLFKP